jgi:hypothetical protein
VVACGAILLATPVVLADAPVVASFGLVRDVGAESCPNRVSVLDALIRRLGRDPFIPGATRSIDVVMARDGTAWVARIHVRDASDSLVGSREIRSAAPQCASMLDAVALAGAIAIDPDAAFRTPPPAAAPIEPRAATPTPAPTPAVATPPVAPAAPARESIATAPRSSTEPRNNSATAALRAIAGFGLLPAPAVGFALTAQGRLTGPLTWSAGAIWFPEVGTPPPAPGDISQYAFGITAGWLAACADGIRAERTLVGVCAGLLAGAIHAVVYNLEPVTPGDRPWFAISLGPRARFRLFGPIAAELGLDAIVPLIRYRFATRTASPDGETVFQQSVVGLSAWLAVGLGF